MLFRRTTRQQSLTEAGEIYLGYAERVVTDLEEGRVAVARLAEQPAGTLRVTAPNAFGLAYVVPRLTRFLERYPDLAVHLELTDTVLDLTREGLDLALRIGPLEDSEFVARRIAVSGFAICASPDYLRRHGEPAHPDELANHSCLTFRTNPGKTRWYFSANDEELEIAVQGRFASNSGAALLDAATAGMGIARLPSCLIHEEVEAGILRTLLPATPVLPLETPIYAVFPRDRSLAPKVRAFVDFFAEELAAVDVLSSAPP